MTRAEAIDLAVKRVALERKPDLHHIALHYPAWRTIAYDGTIGYIRAEYRRIAETGVIT